LPAGVNLLAHDPSCDNAGVSASRVGEPVAFRHEAAFYAGIEGFLDTTMPFIRDAVEVGEPILVAVDADKIRRLRTELGGAADRVIFVDMREMGINPARIIPEWREFAESHSVFGRGMRGIGEPIWSGRGADELPECHRHEALLNLAFESTPSFWLLCPYDTEALEPGVLGEAHRTHPLVSKDGARGSSGSYDEGLSRRPFDGALPDPPVPPATLGFDGRRLDGVRGFVWERARESGLPSRPAGDLVLAVSELANNSVRYGGGAGEIRFWLDDDTAQCEVSDAGRIDDPLAGRAHPRFDQLDGRGLWLVNQLCDLVQIRSSDAGTVVRLSMRIA
jgi:anti-sigma regulatory factor (Ser/Thr protein kinase)